MSARARLLAVAVVIATTGNGRAQQAVDDLGSQPLTEPTPADLGIVDDTPPATTDDAVEAPPSKRRRPSVQDAPRPTAPTAPTAPVLTATPPPKSDKSLPLGEQLRTALHDLDDSDPRALLGRVEAAAALWVQDAAAAADPTLRPLSRLVKARAALLAGRLDDAEGILKEVGAAVDNATSIDSRQARHLRGAVRFHRAAIVDQRARVVLFAPGCGRALGIKRLVRDEAGLRARLLESVTTRYVEASHGPDRFWARRAAFAAAVLDEDMARRALAEADYRTTTLPGPYSVDVVDTSALLDPVLAGWFGELRRVQAEILAAIDPRDPDPALADKVRRRAAELGRVQATITPERVENPWRAELHPGLVRVGTRAERRDASGQFVAVETRVAVEIMNSAVDGTGIDAAYALAGLGNAAPEMLPAATIIKALSSSDERMVVAGLLAAERVVRGKSGVEKAAALRESVLTAYASGLAATAAAQATTAQTTATTTATTATTTTATTAKPFSTLKGTLYGRVERGLLALLAIARADRGSGDAIIIDKRVPPREQAWIAAELADGRFAARYDAWAWDRDEQLAASAVWGSVVGRGRRDAGYLLRPNDTGLVGCVSRHLVDDNSIR